MKQIIFTLSILSMIAMLSYLGCNKTESFFGEWIVTKIAGTSGIYAMSDEEMKSFIGKKAEYSQSLAAFDNEFRKNPVYKRETLSEATFFSGFRTSFENLGLKGESVTIINIYENQNNLWINPGSCLIIKDNDSMLTVWDGVFFEMTRKP